MQNHTNIAIVVAAGSGSRLGSDKPKQFHDLNGREILSYSVQSFLDHPQISQVIIVTSSAFVAQVKADYPECQVVEGGASRQDSVFCGLSVCPKNSRGVLVHDAARPLIPQSLIDECLLSLDEYDGVAPVIMPADSMIQLEGDDFHNLERDKLRVVQTPQCFRLDVLLQAHASGRVDTDEIGLVKQAVPNAKLKFIDGAPETMKITRSVDIQTVAQFLNKSE